MNKDESISFMKELLKKYSLTQTRLASEIGTTKQYVNALCKGTRNISYEYLQKITDIYHSMSPDYKLGYRAIIDTSVQHFIDSQIFVFSMNDNTYIRRVNVMPNQIKCTADNDTYDTFYLQQGDEYKIIGALVPRIRL